MPCSPVGVTPRPEPELRLDWLEWTDPGLGVAAGVRWLRLLGPVLGPGLDTECRLTGVPREGGEPGECGGRNIGGEG